MDCQDSPAHAPVTAGKGCVPPSSLLWSSRSGIASEGYSTPGWVPASCPGLSCRGQGAPARGGVSAASPPDGFPGRFSLSHPLGQESWGGCNGGCATFCPFLCQNWQQVLLPDKVANPGTCKGAAQVEGASRATSDVALKPLSGWRVGVRP